MKKTKEKQYQGQVELQEKTGAGVLGLTTSFFWEHDPKHLLFTLSRYKFAAKLVEGMKEVAEEDSVNVMNSLLLEETAVGAEEYYKYGERINSVKLDDVRKIKIPRFSSISLVPK